LNYHQQWQERERGRAGLTAEVARPQKSSSITSRASGRGPRSGSRWRRWFSERKQDEKTKLTSESEAKTEPRRETKTTSQPSSESEPPPYSDVNPNATSYPLAARVPILNSFSNPITQPPSHAPAGQPRHPPLLSPRSFRLLTLQHENRSTSFLSFVLRSVDIGTCNSFNALSYTWGSPFGETRTETQSQTDSNRPDPQAATTLNPNPNNDREVTEWFVPSHPTLCNGHTVLVCPNLFDALSRLHRDGMLEASWFIDYLCIDQSSLSERGQQVALMGEIYASAQRVFCWLGREDEHSRRVVEVHRLLPPLVGKFVQGHLAARPGTLLSWQSDMRIDSPHMVPRLREQAGLEGLGETPLSMEHWRAYAAFCLRRWFRRTWVVQEMCLARELVLLLGSARLDWSDVATVVLYMYIQPPESRKSFPLNGPEDRPIFSMMHWLHESRSLFIERMDEPRMLLQQYGARSNTERVLAYLLQIIDFHSEFSASDPRDKIYGLRHGEQVYSWRGDRFGKTGLPTNCSRLLR
jgi:transposase-like protein